MTENEAIKVFKQPTKHIKKSMLDGEETICYSTDMVKAFEMAIQALEEIQACRAIGTVEEFKALKEKNEPKKVKGISLTHEGHVGNCPTCGKFVTYREQTTYCTCEQKLAWS